MSFRHVSGGSRNGQRLSGFGLINVVIAGDDAHVNGWLVGRRCIHHHRQILHGAVTGAVGQGGGNRIGAIGQVLRHAGRQIHLPCAITLHRLLIALAIKGNGHLLTRFAHGSGTADGDRLQDLSRIDDVVAGNRRQCQRWRNQIDGNGGVDRTGIALRISGGHGDGLDPVAQALQGRRAEWQGPVAVGIHRSGEISAIDVYGDGLTGPADAGGTGQRLIGPRFADIQIAIDKRRVDGRLQRFGRHNHRGGGGAGIACRITEADIQRIAAVCRSLQQTGWQLQTPVTLGINGGGIALSIEGDRDRLAFLCAHAATAHGDFRGGFTVVHHAVTRDRIQRQCWCNGIHAERDRQYIAVAGDVGDGHRNAGITLRQGLQSG